MKKLLLALALLLLPSASFAQCNGVFAQGTACGRAVGAGSGVPGQVPIGSLATVPGGSNGQVQFNSAGAFGGLTNTQLTALVNAFTSSLSGAVPASGGGTTNFLRADGTFAVPFTWNASIEPQGRITLSSGVPVMTSTVSGATTVYYTPYHGNLVPIYDGTNMLPTAFAEVSQATTDTTKSPAAVAASSCYDEFAWIDTGTNRVTRGPAWTDTSNRSAGTALVLTKGIYLNNLSITNGPAASRGTYVGTICSNSSSQIDYIFGTSANPPTAASLGVWNAYQRVNTVTNVQDTKTSWAVTVGNTLQPLDGTTANRVTFVTGLSEESVQVTLGVIMTGVSGKSQALGLGLNSTTTAAPFSVGPVNNAAATTSVTGTAFVNFTPAIGVNFVQALQSSTDGSTTYFGGVGNEDLSLVLRN